MTSVTSVLKSQPDFFNFHQTPHSSRKANSASQSAQEGEDNRDEERKLGRKGLTCGFYCSQIFVDFWATWCSPCRVMSPVFVQLAHQHPGVKFLKVDIDELQVSGAPPLLQPLSFYRFC